MAKPISPDNITKAKRAAIPDEVFEAFNELIAEKWNGSSATIRQDTVVALAIRKLNAAGKRTSRQTAFDKHYFDVEDAYRDEGWDVDYDKPAYCETYEPTFKFSKKDKR